MSKYLTPTVVFIISLIVFLIFAISTIGPGDNHQNNNFLAVASFLFGIYVAFATASGHSKLSKINEVIKSDEGILLFIYKSSRVFGEHKKKEVQKLIDLYLMDQLDYFLKDYKYSSQSFLKLFDYVLDLNAQNSKQHSVYDSLIAAILESSKNRKTVEALVQERMAWFEWMSILILLGINIFYVFYMNDGSLVSILTAVFLSIAALLLVVVLRELDILKWKEGTWIWEPLQNLYREIDLIPYFPEDLIIGGRIKLEAGIKIRLAHYKHPYPDMSDKVIEEITTE